MPRPITNSDGPPRNHAVDAIKGAAILLVVLGHAIQCHVRNFDDNLIFRLIYSFHMPLFMILSGWFASPEKPWKLKTTAIRLVFPVISWYLILYLYNGHYRTTSFTEYVWRWIQSPDAGLWFLWVLFLCNVSLVLVRRLEIRLGLLAYVVGSGVLAALPISWLGLKMATYYFPFVALGYLISRDRARLARYWQPAVIVSVMLFPLVFPYWHRTAAGSPVFLMVRIACALAGSAVLAYLVIAVSRSPLGQPLAWLGTRTLEIYAIHQSLIPLAVGHGFSAVATSAAIATILSLSAIWLIRKSSWASLVLFGIQRNYPQPRQNRFPDAPPQFVEAVES